MSFAYSKTLKKILFLQSSPIMIQVISKNIYTCSQTKVSLIRFGLVVYRGVARVSIHQVGHFKFSLLEAFRRNSDRTLKASIIYLTEARNQAQGTLSTLFQLQDLWVNSSLPEEYNKSLRPAKECFLPVNFVTGQFGRLCKHWHNKP